MILIKTSRKISMKDPKRARYSRLQHYVSNRDIAVSSHLWAPMVLIVGSLSWWRGL